MSQPARLKGRAASDPRTLAARADRITAVCGRVFLTRFSSLTVGHPRPTEITRAISSAWL